jgi:hypothetical protein
MTTTTISQQARTGRTRGFKLIAGGILGLVLLGGIIFAVMMIRMMAPPPSDLDLSTTRLTEQGMYRATIAAQIDPIVINQIHEWTIHIETPDGQPVEEAEIIVDGGMPQHGHGLPTKPMVTRYLGNGDYLIEGMKFNMPGWWELKFQVTSNGRTDNVTFNLVLK